MSVELQTDDGAVRAAPALEPDRGTEPGRRLRPNVSGNLPTLFEAAPMFRRVVSGYDRFQVDTYVQWAEEELATADREREHLLTRHLRTRADLAKARELLSHSAGGGEFLQVSGRVGSMLAAAADDAESMRAEAEATRTAAAAESARLLADAERVLADAGTAAERLVAEAAAERAARTADAARIVLAAEQAAAEARADACLEAEARLAKVRAMEESAAAQAARIRQQALAEATSARLHARDEIVRMLSTGREERRRADSEAAAIRERRDRDAATHSAALLAEMEVLEQRRAALRVEVELLTAMADTTDGRLDVQLRRLLERLRWRARSLRTP